MTRTPVPPEIDALARQRSEARKARDWDSADRLRAEIESAGWRVTDHGTEYRLTPASPPDVVEGDRVRYGSSGAVPSRLGDPTTATVSVVLAPARSPEVLAAAVAGLEAHRQSGTQVVAVTHLDPDAVEAAVRTGGSAPTGEIGDPDPVEFVWTSVRLPPAGAINSAIRRTAAPVVALLDPEARATGDFLTPLAAALEDASVAVAGARGLTSSDMRRFEPAAGSVDAVDGRCLAFRRDDYLARGPLDEKFGTHRALDVWWSLILRDEGGGAPPRRAVVTDALPVAMAEDRRDAHLAESDLARLAKRDSYRILDRFGQRRDLLAAGDQDARRGARVSRDGRPGRPRPR